jgi:hypothetical protein
MVFAILFILISLWAVGSGCDAQESDPGDSPAPSTLSEGEIQPSVPDATPIPKTYDPAAPAKADKGFGTKLWRAAVTGIGSFPFTFFYTNFIFDSVRFVDNGFDVLYAPWPFKNQYSAEVGTDETFLRLGVSFGLSAVIGLLDAFVPRK